MAQSVPDAGRYVVTRAAVRQSIDRLANRRSHNHLPGYLALLRRRLAAGDGGMRLRDIEGFHSPIPSGAGRTRSKTVHTAILVTRNEGSPPE